MTISSETARVTAEGDGGNTVFNYNFLIPYQADGTTPAVAAFLTVDGVPDPLVLDADYSITGVGEPTGGTVTYPLSGSPLAVGDTITILRDEAYVQPFAFPNQGFRPDQVEEALDWLAMQTQQLAGALAALPSFVFLTQTEYDTIASPDPNTLYFITGA